MITQLKIRLNNKFSTTLNLQFLQMNIHQALGQRSVKVYLELC